MAHELTPWKKPDCHLPVNIDSLSRREDYSREINETYGEGGGLNAGYRTVEAAMVAANTLGRECGFKYGTQFVFKTAFSGIIQLDFCDEDTRKAAAEVL